MKSVLAVESLSVDNMEDQQIPKPKTLIKGYRKIAKYVRDTYGISIYINYLNIFKEKYAFPLYRIGGDTFYSSKEDIAEWVENMVEKDLYNTLLIRDWQVGGKTKQFGEPRIRKYRKRKRSSWGKTKVKNILKDISVFYTPSGGEKKALLVEAITTMLNGKLKNKEIVSAIKSIFEITNE